MIHEDDNEQMRVNQYTQVHGLSSSSNSNPPQVNTCDNALDESTQNGACDLNNNKCISLTSRNASNLFIRDPHMPEISSKVSCTSATVSRVSGTSGSATVATSEATASNDISRNSTSESQDNSIDDPFTYLNSDHIREDIEILVDVYLFFEKTTWLLSAFMW